MPKAQSENPIEKRSSLEGSGAKVRHLLHSWSWLIGTVAVLIALGFLFGPLLQYRVKDDLGNKTYYLVYIWELLNGKYTFDWSVLAAVGLLVVSAVLPLFHKKSADFQSGSMVLSLIATLLIFFGREFFVGNNPAIDSSHVVFYWSYALAGVFAAISTLVFLLGSYQEDNITVHEMTEMGILVALAVALDFARFFKFSLSGGSLTVAMLPLYIIALRYGPVKGFVAGGIVFGLITCMTDGYGLYTYPFDYLFAFGSVGLIGFLRNAILPKEGTGYTLKGELLLLLGVLVCTTFRCLSHTISGILYYVDELDGDNKFLASFLLAAPYCYSSGALVASILMLGYGPLRRVNAMFPVKKGLLSK